MASLSCRPWSRFHLEIGAAFLQAMGSLSCSPWSRSHLEWRTSAVRGLTRHRETRVSFKGPDTGPLGYSQETWHHQTRVSLKEPDTGPLSRCLLAIGGPLQPGDSSPANSSFAQGVRHRPVRPMPGVGWMVIRDRTLICSPPVRGLPKKT